MMLLNDNIRTPWKITNTISGVTKELNRMSKICNIGRKKIGAKD